MRYALWSDRESAYYGFAFPDTITTGTLDDWEWFLNPTEHCGQVLRERRRQLLKRGFRLVIIRHIEADMQRRDYANNCPECQYAFGWDMLASEFEGVKIDPDRTLKKRIVCPECDSVVLVEVLIDFATSVVA